MRHHDPGKRHTMAKSKHAVAKGTCGNTLLRPFDGWTGEAPITRMEWIPMPKLTEISPYAIQLRWRMQIARRLAVTSLLLRPRKDASAGYYGWVVSNTASYSCNKHLLPCQPSVICIVSIGKSLTLERFTRYRSDEALRNVHRSPNSVRYPTALHRRAVFPLISTSLRDCPLRCMLDGPLSYDSVVRLVLSMAIEYNHALRHDFISKQDGQRSNRHNGNILFILWRHSKISVKSPESRTSKPKTLAKQTYRPKICLTIESFVFSSGDSVYLRRGPSCPEEELRLSMVEICKIEDIRIHQHHVTGAKAYVAEHTARRRNMGPKI
ncbi:hypothetical protein BC629DRAFT_1438930 [Irpex lacteus]|nr:hypothetical protein BC629DRAFT_1438930 [Irpex lacteus]